MNKLCLDELDKLERDEQADGDQVVVQDDKGQEVEEEVGGFAVNVTMLFAVVLEDLAANGRQDRHGDEDAEEPDNLGET